MLDHLWLSSGAADHLLCRHLSHDLTPTPERRLTGRWPPGTHSFSWSEAKLTSGAGGRRFKSSRPDHPYRVLGPLSSGWLSCFRSPSGPASRPRRRPWDPRFFAVLGSGPVFRLCGTSGQRHVRYSRPGRVSGAVLHQNLRVLLLLKRYAL